MLRSSLISCGISRVCTLSEALRENACVCAQLLNQYFLSLCIKLNARVFFGSQGPRGKQSWPRSLCTGATQHDCPRVEYSSLSPLRASIAVRMQRTVRAAFVSIVSLYTNASCRTKISTKTLETHSVETCQIFLPRRGRRLRRRSGRKTRTNVWHAFGGLTRANARNYGRTCG